MHGFTYSGHPVGCSVALANIDQLKKEDLVDNAVNVGKHLLAKLMARICDHPYIGDVRTIGGLMLGVAFVADRAARHSCPADTNFLIPTLAWPERPWTIPS